MLSSVSAAMLKDLGIDDFTDKSDDSEAKSLKDTVNSQPNTPRGILKKVKDISVFTQAFEYKKMCKRL